ncbi:MAG TPA: TatD family hydrolase [Chitinophagaceae bacterium]|jgi:TatD DNase family protein|nr:TatD family hydrolase [Chitinophagaceae bacterium]
MQFIDTHAHIYLPEFDDERARVVQQAMEKGVQQILMPAIDAATHPLMLATETEWPACTAMMGLHPCSVNETYKQELEVVETYFKERKFIAIGEIGLDFYWSTAFNKQQYETFETQIGWAKQHNLPVVIHSRNAIDACIDVLSAHLGTRGVFHCFTGTREQAERIMALGFYLGIGGVVTYKNAGVDAVIKSVGLEAVVLETDAPYLAPVPYRGKRNESSYLPLVAEKLASTVGCPIEEVAAITTQNAVKLFKLS